jgi:pyruvate-formate lyase
MNRIAEHPPASLVEAAQLVFTLHSCLHHVGEPTAVGRLDQLLQAFYAADLEAGRRSGLLASTRLLGCIECARM